MDADPDPQSWKKILSLEDLVASLMPGGRRPRISGGRLGPPWGGGRGGPGLGGPWAPVGLYMQPEKNYSIDKKKISNAFDYTVILKGQII